MCRTACDQYVQKQVCVLCSWPVSVYLASVEDIQLPVLCELQMSHYTEVKQKMCVASATDDFQVLPDYISRRLTFRGP